MELWRTWLDVVQSLRPAFSRTVPWHWFLIALMGMTIRWGDCLGGVTAIVRKCWLHEACYRNLLHFFHSNAVDLHLLKYLWTKLVLKIFPVGLFPDKLVLIADGIKIPREGRKMPGVRLLHQESTSNTKPTWIMGHMCQSVGILACGFNRLFCVPLATEIHAGVTFSNRDKRTLHDKLMNLVKSLKIPLDWCLVADAYYGSKSIVKHLPPGCHLLVRLKSNAVGWQQASAVRHRKRGRPRIYGEKIVLRELYDQGSWEKSKISLPGRPPLEVNFRSIDLLWRPITRKVRFILVSHPHKGRMILMTTDLHMEPTSAIELYLARFQIEQSFSVQVQVFGSYCYRFWMMAMDKLKRGSRGIYLHRKQEWYRDQVRRKLKAYELFIHTGMIAQGLCQYLSLTKPVLVLRNFRCYFRTMPAEKAPSERIVSKALENRFFEFLVGMDTDHAFTKFIWERLEVDRMPDSLLEEAA